MTWRLTVTEASKSPKKKRKSLEGSPTSKKARREEALPLPLPPKMAFVEQAGFVGRGALSQRNIPDPVAFAVEASATLPQQHAVIDATFRTRSDGVQVPQAWMFSQD